MSSRGEYTLVESQAASSRRSGRSGRSRSTKRSDKVSHQRSDDHHGHEHAAVAAEDVRYERKKIYKKVKKYKDSITLFKQLRISYVDEIKTMSAKRADI